MTVARAVCWWPPVGLLLMTLLGLAVGTGSTAIDRPVLHEIGEAGQPRWLLLFTNPRLLLLVLLCCLAVALARRQWRLAVFVVVAPAVAITLVRLLKPLFGRYKGEGLAYPSGHTTAVTVVMGIVVLIAGARLWAVAVAVVVSILGALGMIFCGIHYLTDTVGGVLLGSAVACTAAYMIRQPARDSPSVPVP